MLPADLDAYIQYIRGIYVDGEEIMLERLAKRLARGIDTPGWTEQKLAEVSQLRREINAEIASLKLRSGDIEESVYASYDGGSAVAVKELEAHAGAAGVQTLMDIPPPIKALAGELTGAIQSTHLRILRSVEDVYRSTIADASAQTVAGTRTLRESVQAALNSFADQGITGFIDSKKRSWDLVSYTEMATRSVTMNAYRQGHLDTLTAHGRDLVIVSAHGACCEMCAPWEGRILSISGATPGYPTLDSARAAGLFHCNCRHVVSLYTPGLTEAKVVPHDAEAYAARQKQRYNERQIRHWKNRETVAVTDPAEAAKCRAKVKEWQAAQRTHIKAANLAGEEKHGPGWITLKRRSDRERSHGQWGVKQ